MSLDTQETHCHSMRVSRASRRQQVGQQVRPGPYPDLPSSPKPCQAAAFVPWPGPVCFPLPDN